MVSNEKEKSMLLKSLCLLCIIGLSAKSHAKNSEYENKNYWTIFRCPVNGVAFLGQGFDINSSGRIAKAKCYNSCIDSNDNYRGCNYVDSGEMFF